MSPANIGRSTFKGVSSPHTPSPLTFLFFFFLPLTFLYPLTDSSIGGVTQQMKTKSNLLLTFGVVDIFTSLKYAVDSRGDFHSYFYL